jgi:hypothetical protein
MARHRENDDVDRMTRRTVACWLDKTSGYPCLILLGHQGESLGYVRVPPNHPYYGMPRDLAGLNKRASAMSPLGIPA